MKVSSELALRTVEPGVPLPEMWSTRLVMPAQPAPGECRHKYEVIHNITSSIKGVPQLQPDKKKIQLTFCSEEIGIKRGKKELIS